MDTTLFTRPQNNGPLKNACKRYTPLDSIFCASAPPKKWTSAIDDLKAFHPIYTHKIRYLWLERPRNDATLSVKFDSRC